MLSSAATATSVSARSGDILCGLFRKKSVAPFRFTQPVSSPLCVDVFLCVFVSCSAKLFNISGIFNEQVYRTSLCPSFVAVRAMAESQTAQRNQPQSSGSSGLQFFFLLQFQIQ